jgi:4-hydroxy-4-methyl-2-oxoglutarate aldolase
LLETNTETAIAANPAFELRPMPAQVDAALLATLAQAETATIGHWRHWGFCDRGLRRLRSGPAVVGTAVTVACPALDNAIVHYATAKLRPGDILVIDRLNDRDIACFGGVVMRACLEAGAVAAVIDGPCTDSRAIAEAGFPVWRRGSSPRTTNVRGVAGRLNVPVSIGGVVINPGDALLCDDDGVLALPPDEVKIEAERAVERIRRSAITLSRLASGEKLPDISQARRLIEQGSVT